MADNSESSGMNDIDRVREYEQLMLEYEGLFKQIDALLVKHHGVADRMSDEDFERYRELARRRDDIHNQMKALERQMSLDDDTSQ